MAISTFYVSVGHFCVFIGELAGPLLMFYLDHYYSWLLSCVCSLCILEIILHQICILKIFASVTRLTFILLIVSFTVQKLLNMHFYLFIFAFFA